MKIYYILVLYFLVILFMLIYSDIVAYDGFITLYVHIYVLKLVQSSL